MDGCFEGTGYSYLLILYVWYCGEAENCKIVK